eukprot:15440981-Alexandrium_andersonii.AAC.1
MADSASAAPSKTLRALSTALRRSGDNLNCCTNVAQSSSGHARRSVVQSMQAGPLGTVTTWPPLKMPSDNAQA